MGCGWGGGSGCRRYASCGVEERVIRRQCAISAETHATFFAIADLSHRRNMMAVLGYISYSN